MSLQAARNFLRRIEADQALKDRLGATPDPESRWRIVQTTAGDFTLEEFRQAMEEMQAACGQDLTPEDLQEITGGAGWCACKGPQYNYLRL
ncbi:MAG: Nif11-like leader peptide family natural product precursor [Deltaproteobacteria bacterium]|nr:MAG: Nif11-like leader peptide family natural product precursor [Deltaproteobacteria bacterium]